jgi:hypothetical protein
LEDWVSLLTKAKSSVETLKRYNAPEHSTDEHSALSPTQPTVLLTVKLLRGLYAVSRNQDAIKVLHNVQLAALHLACMLKGTSQDVGNRLVSLQLISVIQEMTWLIF